MGQTPSKIKKVLNSIKLLNIVVGLIPIKLETFSCRQERKMVNIYLSLDQEFYKKTLKDAEEEAVINIGDEAKGKDAQWNFDNVPLEEWEIDAEGNFIICLQTDLGYMRIVIPITNNMLEDFITHIVKQLNKFKTMIESLK